MIRTESIHVSKPNVVQHTVYYVLCKSALTIHFSPFYVHFTFLVKVFRAKFGPHYSLIACEFVQFSHIIAFAIVNNEINKWQASAILPKECNFFFFCIIKGGMFC